MSRLVAGVFLDGLQIETIRPLIVILAVIVLARAALAVSGEVSAHRSAAATRAGLRQRLAGRLVQAGPVFLQGERTGELVATAMEGVESLEVYFSQYLPQLALALLVPAVILLLVFPIDALTGAILLLTAPLIPIFMVLIAGQSEAATQRQWTRLARLSAFFLDSIQGLVTLKLLGRSRARAEGIARSSEGYRQATINVLRIAFLSALVLELVGTISMAIVAVEVGLRLLYSGLGYQQALFILILAPEFYLPLRSLGVRFHAAMPAISVTPRIDQLLKIGQDNPIAWGGSGPPKTGGEGKGDPIAWGSSCPAEPIHFDNVYFAYPGDRNAPRPALHGVSFTLEPGQSAALVGPSGAGKSTVMALLLGFIAPTQGMIRVGDRPLGTFSADDWRKCISWVPQQPYLFNDTLEANLRVARPDASLDEIEAAVKLAHLDDFVRSLAAGYQTLVGERGMALSGGEAQRLALARAFLKPAALLLLDEPSANLDVHNETLFQELVERLRAGKTVLTIAHRLVSARRSSLILVMDGGRIVERGTHQELLAAAGLYQRMVNKNGRN